MTKTELMETYTAEQLAEIHLSLLERFSKNTEALEKVVKKLPEELREKTEILLENEKLQSEVEKYRKAFEYAKKERDCQVAECKRRAEKDKTELERAKTTIDQIDDILERLFGVRHDMVDKPDEFEKILSERAKENATDFLPTEPIKAAEMLIAAKGECESLHIGNDVFKDTYRIFDVSGLRQVAEHLLVYCKHNGEAEE